MLVFIDDSGDPGFNIKAGASTHFVVACVFFEDNLVAEETALAIKKYRRKAGFSDRTEFKFSNSRNDIKRGFLQTIAKYDFRVRAIVVDKSLIRSEELKHSKDSFYNYFIKQVLIHSGDELKNAKIKLDGHGDRLFRRNMTTYLRKELNLCQKGRMKNLRLINSKQNVLIQMADMIAGAINRSYNPSRKDNKNYRAIIEKKIEDCWEFK